MSSVGSITGKLVLTIGDENIKIGSVQIPLEVTRVPGESGMALGLGVNLEAVRDTVAEIFRQNRTEEER